MKIITKKKQQKIANEIIKVLKNFNNIESLDYFKLTDSLCEISGEILDLEYLIYIRDSLEKK